MIRRSGFAAFFIATLPLYAATTPASAPTPPRPAPVAPRPAAVREVIIEPVYDGGLKRRWRDLGWAPRDTELGKPARVNFAHNGGWVLEERGLTGTFSAVIFRFKAPAKFGDFLEVHLGTETNDTLPRIQLGETHRQKRDGDWQEVRVPLSQLNPRRLPFERLIFRAHRSVESTWVEIDRIGLASTEDAGALSRGGPTHRSSIQIDCTKQARPISPLIYGIAYHPQRDVTDLYQWRLGATVRRWGGNPASRYNWRLGNAWNTGSDWFFMNVNFTNNANFTWENFFNSNYDHGVQAALTVPIMGWVAKDTTSYSFPVSQFGPQKAINTSNADVGNGLKPNGAKLTATEPRRTSISAPPEFVGEWVRAISRYDEEKSGRSVASYILDNEPALWNSTHRDVHPEPVSYDELIKRTVDYATQIRRADETAVIAGPAEWGWPAYFYSARDADAGFTQKPDQRAHNGVPILAWYLRQLRAHQERTNERLLNVLDLHYYPQGDGIYGAKERNDVDTAERRIRATRSLWDPSYKDESWIADRVRLIPRMRSLIVENYPGLEMSIGEYNFGGERHISGALALAEALGRFGQEGLYSAYYWTYPADNSCAYHAFRVYRNYDGQGARFLDRTVSTTGDKSTSLFASQDDGGAKIVAVALNLDGREGADANIDLIGCGDITGGRTFQYTGTPQGIVLLDEKVENEHGAVKQFLPPYSITVFEMSLDRSRRY